MHQLGDCNCQMCLDCCQQLHLVIFTQAEDAEVTTSLWCHQHTCMPVSLTQVNCTLKGPPL